MDFDAKGIKWKQKIWIRFVSKMSSAILKKWQRKKIHYMRLYKVFHNKIRSRNKTIYPHSIKVIIFSLIAVSLSSTRINSNSEKYRPALSENFSSLLLVTENFLWVECLFARLSQSPWKIVVKGSLGKLFICMDRITGLAKNGTVCGYCWYRDIHSTVNGWKGKWR